MICVFDGPYIVEIYIVDDILDMRKIYCVKYICYLLNAGNIQKTNKKERNRGLCRRLADGKEDTWQSSVLSGVWK